MIIFSKIQAQLTEKNSNQNTKKMTTTMTTDKPMASFETLPLEILYYIVDNYLDKYGLEFISGELEFFLDDLDNLRQLSRRYYHEFTPYRFKKIHFHDDEEYVMDIFPIHLRPFVQEVKGPVETVILFLEHAECTLPHLKSFSITVGCLESKYLEAYPSVTIKSFVTEDWTDVFLYLFRLTHLREFEIRAHSRPASPNFTKLETICSECIMPNLDVLKLYGLDSSIADFLFSRAPNLTQLTRYVDWGNLFPNYHVFPNIKLFKSCAATTEESRVLDDWRLVFPNLEDFCFGGYMEPLSMRSLKENPWISIKVLELRSFKSVNFSLIDIALAFPNVVECTLYINEFGPTKNELTPKGLFPKLKRMKLSLTKNSVKHIIDLLHLRGGAWSELVEFEIMPKKLDPQKHLIDCLKVAFRYVERIVVWGPPDDFEPEHLLRFLNPNEKPEKCKSLFIPQYAFKYDPGYEKVQARWEETIQTMNDSLGKGWLRTYYGPNTN